MKYTTETIGNICYKILPKTTAEFGKSLLVDLPKLIDMCIVELWVNQITLLPEEEIILRRAVKQLNSLGYMMFDNSI